MRSVWPASRAFVLLTLLLWASAGDAEAQTVHGEWSYLEDGTEVVRLALGPAGGYRVAGTLMTLAGGYRVRGNAIDRDLTLTADNVRPKVEFRGRLKGDTLELTVLGPGSQTFALTRRWSGWIRSGSLASSWIKTLSGRRAEPPDSGSGVLPRVRFTFCASGDVIFTQTTDPAFAALSRDTTKVVKHTGRWEILSKDGVPSVLLRDFAEPGDAFQLGLVTVDSARIPFGGSTRHLVEAGEECL